MADSRNTEHSARTSEIQDYDAHDMNVVLWAHVHEEWGGFDSLCRHRLAQQVGDRYIYLFDAIEGLLEEDIPEEPLPEEAVPEEAVPEEAVPEEAVPEEAVPEEAVPEEAVPEEAVPEEAVPEEAVPEEAVPEEAVPEEAVVEETAQKVEELTAADAYLPFYNGTLEKWCLYTQPFEFTRPQGKPSTKHATEIDVSYELGFNPAEVRDFSGVLIIEYLRQEKLGIDVELTEDKTSEFSQPNLELWKRQQLAVVARAARFASGDRKRVLENFLIKHGAVLRDHYEAHETQKSLHIGELSIQYDGLKGEWLPALTLGPQQLEAHQDDQDAQAAVECILTLLSETTAASQRSNLQALSVTADLSHWGVQFHDIVNALTVYRDVRQMNCNITDLTVHHQVVSGRGKRIAHWMDGTGYLSILLARLPNLRVLDLQHNDHMSATQLWPGLRECVYLESLTLDVCPPLYELTALAEAKQARGGWRLRKLSLQGDFGELFTDKGIVALSRLLGFGCSVSFKGTSSPLEGVIAGALMRLLHSVQATSVHLAHHPQLFPPGENNSIGTAMRVLHNGLKQDWLLQDLRLEDVGLNDQNIAPLLYALEMNHSLQSLSLQYLKMSADSAVSLLYVTRHHPQLQSIYIGCISKHYPLSEGFKMAAQMMVRSPGRKVYLEVMPSVLSRVKNTVEYEQYEEVLASAESDGKQWYRHYAQSYLLGSLGLLQERYHDTSEDSDKSWSVSLWQIGLYGTVALASVGLTVAAGPLVSHGVSWMLPFLTNFASHMGVAFSKAQADNLGEFVKGLLKSSGGAVERAVLNQAANETKEMFSRLYTCYWQDLESVPYFISEQAVRKEFIEEVVKLLGDPLSEQDGILELKTFCDDIIRQISALLREYSGSEMKVQSGDAEDRASCRENLTQDDMVVKLVSALTGEKIHKGDLTRVRRELGKERKKQREAAQKQASQSSDIDISSDEVELMLDDAEPLSKEAALVFVMRAVGHSFDAAVAEEEAAQEEAVSSNKSEKPKKRYPNLVAALDDSGLYATIRQTVLGITSERIARQITAWDVSEYGDIQKHQVIVEEVSALWQHILPEAEAELAGDYQHSGNVDEDLVLCTSQEAELEGLALQKTLAELFRKRCRLWADEGKVLPAPEGSPVRALEDMLKHITKIGHFALLRFLLGGELYHAVDGGNQYTYLMSDFISEKRTDLEWEDPYFVWQDRMAAEARAQIFECLRGGIGLTGNCAIFLNRPDSLEYLNLFSRVMKYSVSSVPVKSIEFIKDIESGHFDLPREVRNRIATRLPWYQSSDMRRTILENLLAETDFLSCQISEAFEKVLVFNLRGVPSKNIVGHKRSRWKMENTTTLTRIQQGRLDCTCYLVMVAVHLMRTGSDAQHQAISARLGHALAVLSREVLALNETSEQKITTNAWDADYSLFRLLPSYEAVGEWASRYFKRQRASHFIETLLSSLASMVPSDDVRMLSTEDFESRIEDVSQWVASHQPEEKVSTMEDSRSRSGFMGQTLRQRQKRDNTQTAAESGNSERQHSDSAAVRPRRQEPVRSPHNGTMQYGALFKRVLEKPRVSCRLVRREREQPGDVLPSIFNFRRLQLQHLLVLCDDLALRPTLHLYLQNQKLLAEAPPHVCGIVLKQSPENSWYQNLAVRIEAFKDECKEGVKQECLGPFTAPSYNASFWLDDWSNRDSDALSQGNRAVARQIDEAGLVPMNAVADSGSDEETNELGHIPTG